MTTLHNPDQIDNMQKTTFFDGIIPVGLVRLGSLALRRPRFIWLYYICRFNGSYRCMWNYKKKRISKKDFNWKLVRTAWRPLSSNVGTYCRSEVSTISVMNAQKGLTRTAVQRSAQYHEWMRTLEMLLIQYLFLSHSHHPTKTVRLTFKLYPTKNCPFRL